MSARLIEAFRKAGIKGISFRSIGTLRFRDFVNKVPSQDSQNQQGITRNSLFDQINDLLSLWNPLDVPDYVAGTEYKDYVYDILDILKSGKDLENYIYDDMFVGAMGLGPSELAQREISALCESIEKAYKLYSKS